MDQADSRTEFQGHFKGGKKEGYGVLISPEDGSKYEGHLLNDLPHGEGVYHFADGCKYQGHFKDGIKEGHGVYTSPEEKYEGQWLNDVMHGEGVYHYADDSEY